MYHSIQPIHYTLTIANRSTYSRLKNEAAQGLRQFVVDRSSLETGPEVASICSANYVARSKVRINLFRWPGNSKTASRL